MEDNSCMAACAVRSASVERVRWTLPGWIHSHNLICSRIWLGRWIEEPRVLAAALVALRCGATVCFQKTFGGI
jgi:hypothetical protein